MDPTHFKHQILPALTLVICFTGLLASINIWAGPDWKRIETAREAKRAEKAEIRETEQRQVTTLEKLQAACEKANCDEEISVICDEIITHYQDLAGE